MAEITIGGIGLVSLLALFQTCNRAYDVFIRSAKNLGRDAHFLGVQLEIERQKLRLWGQYLGISRSQQCRLLRAESSETQQLVVMLLDSIKALLDDIDVIMIRYGVKIVEAGGDLNEPSEAGLQDLDLEDIRTCTALKIAQIKRTKTERSIKASTSGFGKLRWALADSPKLSKLIEDLRLINENLWISLPKNKWLALAKGLPSVVLPEILDQTTLAEVERTAKTNKTTKLLAACSDLRRTALISAANESRQDFAEEQKFASTAVSVKIDFNSGDPKGTDSKRRHVAVVTKADGTTTSAVLEWRYVESSFNFEDKKTIRSRIKALAVLLGSERPSEFGLLKCIGFFRDDQHWIQTSVERYGLLFTYSSLPLYSSPCIDANFSSFRPRSLYEYISGTKQTDAYLGDRFRIATALCNIVLQIHASGWLHKAIQSSNVLFFPSKAFTTTEDLDVSHPYLMGFDFSRPDRLAAPSLELAKDRTCNDYRHPSLWATNSAIPTPRYHKHHDIYALGVVLLEIGNWRLVGNLSQNYRDQSDPTKWRDHLLECAKLLGYRCGKIYQEVVETCLKCQFATGHPDINTINHEDDDMAIKGSFLFDVVYKLGQCYA